MDNIQAFVTSNLPPSVLSHLTEHSSTYWKLYQNFVTARDTAYSYGSPVLVPLVSAFNSFTENSNMTTYFLLFILLLLTLKVLNMLQAAIMFWLRLAYNLFLWGGITVLGLWVWQRGLAGSVDDLQAGVQWVMDYWNDSYEGYKQQEELARMAQKVTGGRAGGSGWFGR